MKRVPRNIDIKKESELQECERMMQNYITLLHISSRYLKRAYIKIDEKMPKIGTGLSSTELSNAESREDVINKDADELWATHIENIENVRKAENEKDGNTDIDIDHYLNSFKSKGITVRGATPSLKDEKENSRNNSGMMLLKKKINKIRSKIDTKNPLLHQKQGNSNILSTSASVSSLKSDKTGPVNSFQKSTTKGAKDVRIFKKKDILTSHLTLLRSTEDIVSTTEEGKLTDDPTENTEDVSNINSIKAEILSKNVKEFEPSTEEIKSELTKQSLKYISEQEKQKNNPNINEEEDKKTTMYAIIIIIIRYIFHFY